MSMFGGMNALSLLKMFGMKEADIEGARKLATEAAAKADESYQRLIRIEKMLLDLGDTVAKPVLQLTDQRTEKDDTSD